MQVQRIIAATVAGLSAAQGEQARQVVIASAEVPSGGWTDPRLSAPIYEIFPADGIIDLHALATPPDGPASQAISTVILALDVSEPTLLYPYEAEEVKGFRVHAADNCVVVLIDPTQSLQQERCEILGR